MTDEELLYGVGHVTYRGLLPGPPAPLPPSTWTRQRRRAAERAAARNIVTRPHPRGRKSEAAGT